MKDKQNENKLHLSWEELMLHELLRMGVIDSTIHDKALEELEVEEKEPEK